MQQEARKARASPGSSAEASPSLWVRGGEVAQCCWEKGEQTPLLVPADNSETCVGRRGLPVGQEHVSQYRGCSSPLCIARLGRLMGIRKPANPGRSSSLRNPLLNVSMGLS